MVRHLAHRQRRMDRRNAYIYHEHRRFMGLRGDIHTRREQRELSPQQLANFDWLNAEQARGNPRVIAGVKGENRIMKRGGRPERMGGGWDGED